LSKALFKIAREEDEFNGMNETELREYQMWTMEDLQEYLIDTVKKLFHRKLLISQNRNK